MKPDKRARGTIPRFIALPYPDSVLLSAAKELNNGIKLYWKELSSDDAYEVIKEDFEELMKDGDADVYVKFCFLTSQKVLTTIKEEKDED